MDKSLKMLEEKGVRDRIEAVLKRSPDVDIATILEYEISRDEELEDIFLEEAHENAIEILCHTIVYKAVEAQMDEFFV